MKPRLGQILVDRNLLSPEQLETLLRCQDQRRRPIGLLAEELFDLDPASIEEAWARQYALGAEHVDPQDQVVEPRALRMVDRRQAWQFGVLPIRFDGPDLLLATTEDNLPRALRFVSRCVGCPCFLLLSDPTALGGALSIHYPMAGLDGSALAGGSPVARILF